MTWHRHRTGAFTFGRRAFLAGAAGVALPLPTLEALSGRAHAAPLPGGPRRMILWHQPQGTVYREWALPGAAADTTEFRLGKIVDPLERHRARSIFVRGLDNKVYTISEGEAGHGRVELTVVTPRPALPGAKPNGPSFDYEVHRRVRGPEHRDPLHIGIGPGNWVNHFSPGPGRVVYSNANPKSLLSSIVGKTPRTGGDAAAVRARRLRVLDAVRENFRSFRGRLGPADRERLDQHEAAMGDLEKLAGGTAQQCVPPTVATNGEFVTLAPAQIEVAVFALACNVTPVVTIDWTEQNHAGPPFTDYARDYGQDWHDMIHRKADAPGAVQCYRFMTEQLARLLDRLVATPAGDGRTLLDDTLVVAVTDFGNHANFHSATCTPALVAGNAGPAVKTGRVLTLADVEKDAPSKWSLNNLYVSVLRAFGGTDEAYGHIGDTRSGPVIAGAVPGMMS